MGYRKRARQRAAILDQTETELKDLYGIRCNTLITFSPLHRPSLRGVFGALGLLNIRDNTAPHGLEFMATDRTPQTMRFAQAFRNWDGSWKICKLNFSAAGRGYSTSNVRVLARSATYEEALQTLKTFSRITVENPVKHRRYGRAYIGTRFGSKEVSRWAWLYRQRGI